MQTQLLIDNWALQDVGKLLHSGLNPDTGHEIRFSGTGRSFKYVEVSENLVRVECLFQLLNNVVFADELIVDEKFVYTWEESIPLRKLMEKGVVAAKSFEGAAPKWTPEREWIAEKLCSCAKLRRVHGENVRRYAKDGSVLDPMLSQLLWGGAGCLARASYCRVPYVGHPLRERLFSQSGLLLGPGTAQREFESFVQGQRTKFFRGLDSQGYFATLNLPPVAVRIVEGASSLEDMLKIAMQVRDEFRSVRSWLGELQRAMEAEDVEEIARRKKLLASVAKNVDALTAVSPEGETSLQFGFNWLKLVTKLGSPLNAVRNRFGVRAAMNRLIVAPPGQRAFKRLLRLFGEEKSTLGRRLEEDLKARGGLTN